MQEHTCCFFGHREIDEIYKAYLLESYEDTYYLRAKRILPIIV